MTKEGYSIIRTSSYQHLFVNLVKTARFCVKSYRWTRFVTRYAMAARVF